MNRNQIDRRSMLAGCGFGAGSLAFQTLSRADDANDGHRSEHFPATARNVIVLFMAGGPSQVDTFDPKPDLARYHGYDVPEFIARNVPKIKRAGLKNLMASPWQFKQYGQSGIPVSDLMPHVARQVDDLCVIRSVNHRNPVHGPGECVALTGTGVGDRPSIGAWSIYGLGSVNKNLPAFVAMNLKTAGMQYPQVAGWGTGFLPSRFQGTVVDPVKGVRDIRMPAGVTNPQRRKELDLLDWFNRRHLDRIKHHSELEARIRSYELAFRMQASVPELFDVAGETEQTKTLYGLNRSASAEVGRGCLLARRMVERGVRFVQIRVGGWDAHGHIKRNHESMCDATDQPIAALLADLKRRGLLGETLVVWAGEFGRTPTMEGRGMGRDHSPAGYTVWFAGGGVRGGKIIGQTDPLGYVAVERPVSPMDLHATMLHAIGIDADRLVYNHHGLRETPTIFGGEAIHEAFG